MAGPLEQAVSMLEQLRSEWSRKNPNLRKCEDLLGKLKVALLELNFLPTSGSKLTKRQLILARPSESHGTSGPLHNGREFPLQYYIYTSVQIHALIPLQTIKIRDEIAGCIEKAYENILFNEASRTLFFTTPKKMTEYAKKRGWLLGPDNYYSFTSQQQKPEEVTIPSTELAKQVIEYARHLEMIV
ncbi:26S proteasome non-ATPase regulatory subunit 8 [Stegostoma tigrinum]|uniref:26S proteasome non-ATPase regulatory subunit 8 n=1 Tax=Stegostoma tigrinum TaxID=3053191 RepID=UPI0028702FC1|nr:26S proteasome non-ATPase regulatory subunit 8 [Stegostoma tigrinum]